VKNRDWEKHPEVECKKNQAENEAAKQIEMNKRMEELQKFQVEEERKLAEKKKRDAEEAKQRMAAGL